jgi:L-lactate dehydrogenase complex protein LldG
VADPLDTRAARERILARLRAAHRTGDLPVPESEVPIPRSTLEEAPREVLIARFAEELRLLGVAFHREPDAEAVERRVRALLGSASVLAWAREALPYELGARLRELPLRGPGTPRAEAAACGAGFVGVHAAIAETGSLVCLSSPTTPRSASLLPPRFVAVVREAQLLPTLGAFLRTRVAHFPDASAVHVITGPSRTADIELQLTLGVHGPGEVAVVLGP